MRAVEGQRSSRLPGSRTTTSLLIVVVLVGALVRLWGIGFGLPHPNCRPDEGAIASIAGGFYHGDLNPHTFNYPALFMLAVAGVMRVVDGIHFLFDPSGVALNIPVTSTVSMYVIARLLSAAAGTASILALYRIGERLMDRSAALAAAAFLSLAFLHVRDSHFGVTDVAMTFMTLVGFLWIVRLSQSGQSRDLVAAGLFAGLAAATKYNAALLLLPAAVAILGTREPSGLRRVGRLGGYSALMALAFLVAAPYSALTYQRFIGDLAFESRHLAEGHGTNLGRGWIYHLTTTLRYGLGIPLLAGGIVGLAGLLWKERQRGLLVAAFPLAYYLLIGSGRTVFARYALPLVPFLCLAAAWSVGQLAGWIAERTRRPGAATAVTIVLALALLWPSAISILKFDKFIGRPDSRVLARQWIEQRFPAGTAIAQIGPEGGHVFLHDANEVPYQTVEFSPNGARPELVIVQSSPLNGAAELDGLAPILEHEYEPRFTQDVAREHPDDVYDRQDEFYLPMAGFRGVDRPGPNLTIYVLRQR